jgi:hypothetical protein
MSKNNLPPRRDRSSLLFWTQSSFAGAPSTHEKKNIVAPVIVIAPAISARLLSLPRLLLLSRLLFSSLLWP